MNRLTKALAVLFVLSGTAMAGTVKYNGQIANEAGVSYAKAWPLALNNTSIDQVSFQFVWSSAAVSNTTFTDGSASSFTITVGAITALNAQAASDNLKFLTNSVTGAVVTVNGTQLTNGVNWYSDITSTGSALSLKNSINALVPGVIASTGALSTVFTTATISGAYSNNMILSVNTSSITVATANFTGGRDNASVSVDGFSLMNGRDWFTLGASSATAKSIAAAINANLSSVVASTSGINTSIVWTTSTIVGLGADYATATSTQTALTIAPFTSSSTANGSASGFMGGGTNASYTLVNGSATVINSSNTFSPAGETPMTALAVVYSTGSGQPITGLNIGTTYYVIPINSSSFGLASTSTGAIAGIYVNLTSSQTKTTADGFNLKPQVFSGTPSGIWQASNDGSTWTPFTGSGGSTVNISTQTFTPVYPSTSSVIDFGSTNFSWMQFNMTTPPTTGALQVKITANGKNSGL